MGRSMLRRGSHCPLIDRYRKRTFIARGKKIINKHTNTQRLENDDDDDDDNGDNDDDDNR